MDAEVQELTSIFDAGAAAFNAKNVDGYLESTHPAAWTYQGGIFSSVEALRPVVPTILESADHFSVTKWLGGLVVGDCGAAWGEYEFAVKGADGATTSSTGHLSAHFVRVDGAWCILFTHYTPASV